MRRSHYRVAGLGVAVRGERTFPDHVDARNAGYEYPVDSLDVIDHDRDADRRIDVA
jgi:hypothetical protein